MSINEFEFKFEKLAQKLNAKAEQINHQYETDTAAIQNKFETSKVDALINDINEYREQLLNSIYEKRSQQLLEANQIFKNYSSLKPIKEKLNKDSLCLLNPSSINESLLYKYKLTKPFDLKKLLKYIQLIQVKKTLDLKSKQIELKLSKNHSIAYNYHEEEKKLLMLRPNRFFLLANVDSLTQMLVIDSRCNILHKKKLEMGNKSDEFKTFMVTYSYIIRRFENKIEIYNFKLNLINSINDGSINLINEFCVHHNEIAFYNEQKRDRLFCIFDLDYKKKSLVRLKYEDYSKYSNCVHFNKERIYFIEYYVEFNGMQVSIYDKTTSECLVSIPVYSHSIRSVKFDLNSNIYVLNNDFDENVQVFNEYGEGLFKYAIGDHTSLFRVMMFSLNDTIVFNLGISKDCIQYEEY